MNIFNKYDIIVIGGGHAGCEAAMAAATLQSRVLMVTMNMNTIGQMSCNPAMGGVAKGQILREIDALGGYSGIIADKTAIQFRMLNSSKGPAMWSPRTQNDKMRFAEQWRTILEKNPLIDFWQDTVKELLIQETIPSIDKINRDIIFFDDIPSALKNSSKRKQYMVIGVKTGLGLEIKSSSVILASGTFMSGIIHIGEKQFGGGRMGDKASFGITEQLKNLGFVAGKMKTGTPPRVDGRSLNYDNMEEQKGDDCPQKFSFLDSIKPIKTQKSCYITYTNKDVHNKLKEGLQYSPMFSGRIKGVGPRYCPSIEDKITRFANKERHQIFVEPEGINTVEIYVNGFSSSLPENIQYESLKKIPGFENVKMFRPGYAIEYDFFPPTQVKPTLETKLINNLYFAGQINGTTGYEEAACQGLMAGINAHLKNNNDEPFILKRSEAYIGVLIDDLTNKGTDEPYRMFTSRAEFRILLRQDNADIRLTKKGHEIKLASDERLECLKNKEKETREIISLLKKTKFSTRINNMLESKGSATITEKQTAYKLLKRPEIDLEDFINLDVLETPKLIDKNNPKIDKKLSHNKVGNSLNAPKVIEVMGQNGVCDTMLPDFKNSFKDDEYNTFKQEICRYKKESLEQASIQVKYESYILKEKEHVCKISNLENLKIHNNFDYNKVMGLSNEGREKLKNIKPITLGCATRISGVSSSDVSVLMVYLRG